MTFLNFIDLYCERTAPGLWNEPLNAISNIAFLISAWIAWRTYQTAQHRSLVDVVLICLAASIGVGSFLFHIFANGQTELLDVIPIWSFVVLYVGVVIFRLSGGNLFKTVRIFLIVIASVALSFWLTGGDVTTTDASGPDHLNGSLQYLPALVAVWVFAIIALARSHPAGRLVVLAAVCFTASLGFRTIDLMTCAATGFGTHFLWHILNGAMVLLLLLALIRHVPPPAEPRAASLQE